MSSPDPEQREYAALLIAKATEDTHDLERLLMLAARTGTSPPPDVADAGWLTPWAVQFRYDDVVEPLDQAAALAATDAAVRWATAAIAGA